MKTEESSANYLWLLPLILIVPFVPLLLALVEMLLFKTQSVEGFCKQIGIHDELSKLYSAVFDLFAR